MLLVGRDRVLRVVDVKKAITRVGSARTKKDTIELITRERRGEGEDGGLDSG